jgi:hypothetical protein
MRSWTSRRRPAGFLGGALFLAGAAAVLVTLALVAILGLVVLALVGVSISVDRLFGMLVPAYRRRRRGRSLTVPAGLVRMVRFGSAPREVIEVRSSELPHDARTTARHP